MKAPRVSVLMSVYNGACYLREAVESILGQTFGDFEFLIVDDGSTDATAGILAEYQAQDPRIIVLGNHGNLGLTRSLNRGLALARGEYVARHDADDVALAGRLAAEVAHLDRSPQTVLVSANYEIIDAGGDLLEAIRLEGDPMLVRWHLVFFNYIGCHSAVMFRREPVLRLGGYDQSHRYSQDYGLWMRLAELGHLAILPEVLQRHRVHPANLSSMRYPEQERTSLEISRRRLEGLAGRQFTLEEVARLRAFWLDGRLDPGQAAALNATLQQICAGFVAELDRRGALCPEGAARLGAAIAERFIRAYESQWDTRGSGYRACLAQRDAWKARYERLAAAFPVNWMLSARRWLFRAKPTRSR
ncbi:MAG: glycosyltransferase [Thermoguttaceae bacterium]